MYAGNIFFALESRQTPAYFTIKTFTVHAWRHELFQYRTFDFWPAASIET